MRNGVSLSKASKNVGIEPETVRSNVGKVIYKRKGRWHVRKNDTIQRGMIIYENGHITHIIVKNSKTASLIGKYMNDVKKSLYSGDWVHLEKYESRVIIDIKGKRHRVEINPVNIQEIELRKENHEENEGPYDY